MKLPKGSKVNPWKLVQQKQNGTERWVIWRTVRLPDQTRKLERLPVEVFKSIRDNETELKKLVIRLNESVKKEDRAREIIEIRHAYIDQALLDDYLDYLTTQIPSKGKATTLYHYTVTYFLDFFINELKLNDPLEWHQVHKTKWAKFLTSKDVPGAADTKKKIVAGANRFISWLHDRRPKEVPPLEFKPLTKAKYKEIEAQRKLKGEITDRKIIKDVDLDRILKEAGLLTPLIRLGEKYGLRRSEIMGLTPKDVRKGYLSVERQLIAFTDGQPVYGPLKGRDIRQVPHWFCTPAEGYNLISQGVTILMHPDTFTDRWNELMNRLHLDYDIHDLRHTFITKAIRVHKARDVQLAVGHKNIETTMQYAHDDRELEDEEFIPDAG